MLIDRVLEREFEALRVEVRVLRSDDELLLVVLERRGLVLLVERLVPEARRPLFWLARVTVGVRLLLRVTDELLGRYVEREVVDRDEVRLLEREVDGATVRLWPELLRELRLTPLERLLLRDVLGREVLGRVAVRAVLGLAVERLLVRLLLREVFGRLLERLGARLPDLPELLEREPLEREAPPDERPPPRNCASRSGDTNSIRSSANPIIGKLL